MLWLIVIAFLMHSTVAYRYIDVGNNNGFPIWIQTQTNNNLPPLIDGQIVKLNPGERKQYDIDDSGWAGRLWPKVGCDNDGSNCEFGQSIPPCPNGGCHPPAETKVEFFFPAINAAQDSYYDISLVDGYSLGSEIIPYRDGNQLQEGSCIRTDCHLRLDECPNGENHGLGDLTVRGQNDNPVACLSPCKKWNYPPPYGQGQNEQEGDGKLLCCPAPVSVDQCRAGIVKNTAFVNLVHRACPTAYGYSYDDEAGLHNCPSTTSFVVNFYS